MTVAPAPGRRRGYPLVKRALDVIVSLLLLLLTAPVLAVACAAVRLQLGAPVLFVQERTGRDLRRFRLYKLRTMTDSHDQHGRLLPDHERQSRLGQSLRRFSIDELPQLFNVLRGDMSLVGPRPLLPRYDRWYSDAELVRFTVRPGITGLAQVNGRNAASWSQRLAFDVRYATEYRLTLDLQIAGQTVMRVLRSAGVAADPASEMADLDHARGAVRQ
jgi:lipopolysaccharide/colanic/teichoic acid biosynthesis glycosyltransferase